MPPISNPPLGPESEPAPDLRNQLREAEERTEHLQLALANSRRIGMALGIIMRERGCTEEQAFDALRQASMRRNIKLRDIAESVVYTGTL